MNRTASAQIPATRALTSMRQIVPSVHSGSVYLFQGESDVLYSAMQELVDRFALQESVKVVVGGNRIRFDHLPLIIGEQAGNIYEILDRISVSRAETCYQMLDVLQALDPSSTPVVIMDMLASFYEDDLTAQEVTMRLQNCIERVQKLSDSAPVLVSASGDPSRPNLLEILERHSDTRFYFEPSIEAPDGIQIVMPGI